VTLAQPSNQWLAQLQARFIETHRARHARLDELADNLSGRAELDETIFLLHRIAGVAGTVGYAPLGAAAKDLEIRMSQARDAGTLPPNEATLDALEDLLDMSQAVLLGQPAG